MSILIKGMEMPEADYQPVMIDWVDGVVKDISQTKVLGEVVIIPTPHGRLADVDKIHISGQLNNIQRLTMEIGTLVGYAPTIIEAEE